MNHRSKWCMHGIICGVVDTGLIVKLVAVEFALSQESCELEGLTEEYECTLLLRFACGSDRGWLPFVGELRNKIAFWFNPSSRGYLIVPQMRWPFLVESGTDSARMLSAGISLPLVTGKVTNNELLPLGAWSWNHRERLLEWQRRFCDRWPVRQR